VKPVAERRAEADHVKLVAQQQEEDDMRWLMASERGRRLVWQWLGEAGLFRSSYSNDPVAMAFREGERNRALVLQAQVMKHAPEQFIRMLAEAQAPSGSKAGAHTAGTAP
jgi:hypothetical protein